MNDLGVKRVVYSTIGGALTSCKMSDYIPKSITLGRRYIQSDFQLGKKPIDEDKQKKLREQIKDSWNLVDLISYTINCCSIL